MGDGAIILGDKQKGGRTGGPLARKLRLVAAFFVAAGCVAWSVDAVDEQTRVRQALLDVARIGHAARLFRVDHGRCPTGIFELVAPPSGAAYLEQAADPWGEPYRLLCPARRDPGGVDVISLGADGSLSGEDNISSL
jgi:hypothetical protein